MSQTGPITRHTDALALGLAKIRIGVSATFINTITKALSGEVDSIGSLVNTKYAGNTDWYKHQSGFPLLDDYVIALRDSAQLECAFEEITPFNVAMAMGIDPTSGYTLAHSGEIALGGRTSPAYVRMEAEYTFPNGSNTMVIIFPKAQAVSNVEIPLQREEAANVPLTFESKRADGTGGSAVWNSMPLGRIMFFGTDV